MYRHPWSQFNVHPVRDSMFRFGMVGCILLCMIVFVLLLHQHLGLPPFWCDVMYCCPWSQVHPVNRDSIRWIIYIMFCLESLDVFCCSIIASLIYNKQFLCLCQSDLDVNSQPNPMTYVTLFDPNVIVGMVLIEEENCGSGRVLGFFHALWQVYNGYTWTAY